MILNSNKRTKLYKFVIAFGCIAFAVALSSYAFIGSFMRYSGDDYCYGEVLTRHGFWKAQIHSYLVVTPYSGNRYSLTLFAGIAGLFPPIVNGFLPGLAIVLWVVGMVYSIRAGAKLIRIHVETLEAILLAEFIVFITFYQAPDISQSLYWRSGMLPYLAPLIVSTFLIGLMLNQMQRDRVSPIAIGGIGVLSLLAGGFSETGAALQIGFLVMATLGAVIAKKRGAGWAPRAVSITGIALIGTMLAILLLVLSPTNRIRQMQMQLPPSPDVVTLMFLSLKHALDFIVGSFRAIPTPIIVSSLFFFVLAFIILSRQPRLETIKGPHLIITLLLNIIVGYLLTVCCMAPFAYAQSAYPEPRALIMARFVMVVTATFFSWFIGLGISTVYRRVGRESIYPLLGGIFLLGIISLYPLRAARNVLTSAPRYQKWASFWDERDQEIRAFKQAGILDVEVVKIDHIIPHVGDLSHDPGAWYNLCAQGYYGVHSISANKPGWDD